MKNFLQLDKAETQNKKLGKKHLPTHQGEIAKPAIAYGLKALAIFAVIFLGWASFLPIESASIADGTVVLDFNRKTIQHLEGGIIDEIFVKEGQMIETGQTLLYLNDIKAKSEQQILKERLWTMQMQKQRLMAEKNEIKELNFDDFSHATFHDEKNSNQEDKLKFDEICTTQLKLFESRNSKRHGEVDVLRKKLISSEKKLKLLQTELGMIKPLVKEDNLPLLRQLEVEKSIAEVEEQVATNRLQILNYQSSDLADILKEIKETDIEIVALYNQLNASKDIVKRSAIVAPTSGKVMNIKYHTIGAVVPPGGEIMNIVPQNEELIIEAKVKPQDIDNIAVGMKSKIMLTAYKGKRVPKINGEVKNISPDIVINEQTRESFFVARVAVSKEDISQLKSKVELYPGMPAQVFIITGSRSLVSYLFTPISDSAYKAFREE
jgi:HlyD family type I secretion membrane fusion protein